MSGRRPGLLYVSSCMEQPAVGGNPLRVESAVQALSGLCELHVCVAVRMERQAAKRTRRFYSRLCRRMVALPSARTGIGAAIAKLRRSGRRRSAKQKDAAFLAGYMDRHAISTVWFDRATGGFYGLMRELKTLKPACRVVCDTDSVWSRFLLGGARYAATDKDRIRIVEAGQRKQEEEKDWFRWADVVTAVSEVDADTYRGLAPNSKQVRRFSNVIDPEKYKAAPAMPCGYRQPCAFLAGSFYEQGCPMEDAARWLVRDIWPKVRQSVGQAYLYVVGRGSDGLLSDISEPGVTITGELSSVLPYLCHANVALVPLRFESGTRFKILEAGACRVPVVSTALGAEGIPVTHGKDILIADDAETFAEAIVQTMSDRALADSLAGNLHKLVLGNFSVTALREEAREILDHLEQV